MSVERLYGAFDGMITISRCLLIAASVLAVVTAIVALSKERDDWYVMSCVMPLACIVGYYTSRWLMCMLHDMIGKSTSERKTLAEEQPFVLRALSRLLVHLVLDPMELVFIQMLVVWGATFVCLANGIVLYFILAEQ